MGRRLTERVALASALALGFGATAAAAHAHHSSAPPTRALAHDVPDSNGFTQTFTSEDWLHAPIAYAAGQVPRSEASDYIFVNAANSIQSGPVILNAHGQVVWFSPLGNRGTYDVNVQQYDRQQVLTYYGAGTDYILNHYYQQIATVKAGNGYTLGIHEFQLTPQGTALITVDKHVPWNLKPVGGPRKGTLIDDAIQEINVSTGQVLWQWDADQHISLTASYAGKATKKPYDFTHINSIQQLPNGNLLISARHTWSIYEIDKQTGKILWTLGGKRSNFKMGPGTHFYWQHDARMQPDGTITLFDDGAGLYRSESQSRALRIRLNYKTHRATLVKAYSARPPVLTYSQGNVQVLPGGNTFVDFGSAAFIALFARNGRQLFSLHFPRPLQTYRAYLDPWWGRPTWPPSISTTKTDTGERVFASWNGSTEVRSWRVLAGPNPTTLSSVGVLPKQSFETEMWVPSTAAYFAVQALSGGGQVLATSAARPR